MKIIKAKETKNCITIKYNSVTYSISKQAYLEYALYDGKDVSEDNFKELINIDTRIRCLDYLSKCISTSIHSEFELRFKAKIKGFKEDATNECISKLKEYGYINDLSQIKELIELYITQNKSNAEIANALINKGYIESDVLTILSSYSDETSRIENLYEKYKNKYKKDIDKEKIQNKIINYLLNKGYDYIDIKKVVGTYYGEYD